MLDPHAAVRSVRFRRPGAVELVTSKPAHLGANDVRIAPSAVGLCGTDAHIVAGSFAAEEGVVLGHEVCGRVIERGAAVHAPDVGDLVTVEPHHYCTGCRYCRAGQEHLCIDKRGYGVRLDGGMADQMVVPARVAYALPEQTVPWVGALCEPVSCCIHGMDRLRVISGEPLLIYGCGPAGAIIVALARLLGANPIVAMDPNPARRALAQTMGADLTLDAADPRAEADARAVTDDAGFPAVVDAVGSADVLERAVSLAARGGRILEFGVAGPEETAAVRPYDLFSRELTLVGSVINPYTHQRAVGMLPRLGLERLTPAFFEIPDFEQALRGHRDGIADKVFITPQGADVARRAGP